jgi:hypothetical protein
VPAVFLRPWGLLVLVIGAISFAMTLAWWIVPLTLATYAALVLLAARNPLFRTRALGKREIHPEETRLGSPKKDVSPKQRARLLPRGETRQKVEAVLEVSRRTVIAIEESGGDTKGLLSDAIPKLIV